MSVDHPFVAQAFRPTKCVHCMYAPGAHEQPVVEPCEGCGDTPETYLGCEACGVTPEKCREDAA